MAIEVLESVLGRQRSLSKDTKVKIFAGSSNPSLTEEIARYLRLPVSGVEIKRFSDGEIFVRVDETVRGYDIFLVQPTSTPANESIMELLITIDALKRASANSINIVMPYYGYARQDRKAHGREAITSKLVADLITTAGADRVITMDLHAAQIQGFFNIKVDHLCALPVFVEYFKNKELHNPVIVSPDAGGVERTRLFAKKLNDAPIAIIDKRRSAHNVAEVYNLIGDVNDRDVVIIDDMIDTFGTLQSAGKMLKDKGARRIFACATHAVFSGPAYERINDSVYEEIVVTNTINPDRHSINSPKIKCLSISSLLGEAVYRICENESISELFD